MITREDLTGKKTGKDDGKIGLIDKYFPIGCNLITLPEGEKISKAATLRKYKNFSRHQYIIEGVDIYFWSYRDQYPIIYLKGLR